MTFCQCPQVTTVWRSQSGSKYWARTMTRLSTVAKLSFFALSFSSCESWAAPVELGCSGAWWNTKENVENEPVHDLLLTVDIEAGKVSGSYGVFKITHVTNGMVFFERPYEESGRIVGQVRGHINRLSGETLVESSRDEEKSPITVYQLQCQRPLF